MLENSKNVINIAVATLLVSLVIGIIIGMITIGRDDINSYTTTIVDDTYIDTDNSELTELHNSGIVELNGNAVYKIVERNQKLIDSIEYLNLDNMQLDSRLTSTDIVTDSVTSIYVSQIYEYFIGYDRSSADYTSDRLNCIVTLTDTNRLGITSSSSNSLYKQVNNNDASKLMLVTSNIIDMRNACLIDDYLDTATFLSKVHGLNTLVTTKESSFAYTIKILGAIQFNSLKYKPNSNGNWKEMLTTSGKPSNSQTIVDNNEYESVLDALKAQGIKSENIYLLTAYNETNDSFVMIIVKANPDRLYNVTYRYK